jgi:hypothetical protein
MNTRINRPSLALIFVAALLLFLSVGRAFASSSVIVRTTRLAGHARLLGTVKLGYATSTPKIVYASYMHAYILGDYVGTLPTSSPDDLADWPTSEMSPRSWWPDSLNAIAQAGTSSEALDLSLAQQAGIDAFALLISPTNIQPVSAYLPGMERLASAASTSSVKLIPDIWFSTDTSQPCSFTNPCDAASWAAFGQNVKNYMDQYPNAFLTVGGKYVISVSSALYQGQYVTARSFSHFFDPWGGSSTFRIIESASGGTSQSTFTASGWADVVQGLSMWTGDAGWDESQYTALPLEASYRNTFLSWPIHSASFAFRPGAYFEKENFGVTNMIEQWKYAITNNTRFAEVQTWNDFTEDHAITDTNTKGMTLIHLTRYFSDWFTSDAQPTITKDRLFIFYQRQLVNTTLTDATATATPPYASESPMVDYLDVVSMLTEPGTLTLADGTLNMQISVPAGEYEWLVYVPSSRSGINNYPTTTSSREVDTVGSIPANLPSVQLTRGGNVITTATGPIQIVSTAQWQDMSMVGAESPDTNPAMPY